MKQLLIISCILMFFLNTYSQTSIGIKAGFNYSTARAYFNGIEQSTDFVPGANAGLQVETVFEGRLHFAPLISYNGRGYIIHADSNKNDQNRSIIHYISIAPILGFHFGKKNTNGFMISLGPMLGVAITGEQKITAGGLTTTSKLHFSTTSKNSIFDIGLHGGLSYRFKKIFVEGSYDYGLQSINNHEETDKQNIRNNTFSISLGYYFKSYN